ncbi:DUF305 domain-containing protein [Streptomyces uncialis]|uniref:DUF305 domain-containing protein n=1 Tax=Streptomyces uncialis TaxID=1048205 RepID=UPI0033CA115E
MTAFQRVPRRPVRRLALVSAVAAASLVLAACGGDDNDMDGMDHGSDRSAAPSATGSGEASGDSPAPGAFNDADVMFAQMMIPHHEQALEMSALADGRAKDAAITSLSKEISGAQDPEIEKMRSWLKAWGKPESADGTDHGGHSGGSEGSDESGGMSGMMTAEDMAALKGAKGTAFDKKFAQLMIDHHNGAIEMARDEQKNGRNATAKALADDVVKAQRTEVDQLQEILDRL